jgi:hypothetical protein
MPDDSYTAPAEGPQYNSSSSLGTEAAFQPDTSSHGAKAEDGASDKTGSWDQESPGGAD